MIVQMWKMHWITASLAPDTVTARSVEFGSISLATLTVINMRAMIMRMMLIDDCDGHDLDQQKVDDHEDDVD